MSNELTNLIKLEQDSRDFGFEWPNVNAIINQINSECAEIIDAIENKEPQFRVQEEIGDLIHAAISLCLFAGFDVQDTLTRNNLKYSKRMTLLKKLTHNTNLKNLKHTSTEFMLQLWDKVKELETAKQ